MTKPRKQTPNPTPKASKVAQKAANSAPAPRRSAPAGKKDRAIAAPPGKLARLVTLLRRPNGASLQALIDETGWQAHSIRGAISGAIKKKLALTVESKRVDGERIYRIVG